MNEKFQSARLLIYSVNNQAGWKFFQATYSFIMACLFIRDFRLRRCQDCCIHSEKYVPDILLMFIVKTLQKWQQ